MEQRIKYKEHPDLIMGKEITVRYFKETQVLDKKNKKTRVNGKQDNSAGTENKLNIVRSLRFPTVKAVWENGQRNV
jgi:hypothetical protein